MYRKWLIVRVVGRKECNDKWDGVIGWISVVKQHLQSLFNVIELSILCAFVCKVECFDAQIRETLLYK